MKNLVLFAFLALFAVSAMASQASDPRITQTKMLALIGMDPVDINYKTNYDTHLTGVLLEPSPGPIQGKSKWYQDRAVPAGTLVDIPKGAKIEPYDYTSPNGQHLKASKVTPSTNATIYACGNGHTPDGPMIMKLLDPNTKIEQITVEMPAAAPAGITLADLNAVMNRVSRDMIAAIESNRQTIPIWDRAGFWIVVVIVVALVAVLTLGQDNGTPPDGQTGGAFIRRQPNVGGLGFRFHLSFG